MPFPSPLLSAQRNEITEHFIYKKLSENTRNEHNKNILKQISEDELKHYNIWKIHTKQEIKPSNFKIWFYYYLSQIFGLSFGLKLMENGESSAQINYKKLSKEFSEAEKISQDEEKHEKELINLISEEKLKYIGSIVLGLNDALVEFTGALAGFTFVLQNGRLIAVSGLIAGIAASFSMGASEYLSTKSENGQEKTPFNAAIYTTIAYILTVFFLILPYLLFSNIYLSLGLMISVTIFIILIFNFYISVAKDLPFKKRFLEMVGISLGVSALSFGIGYLVRIFFNINI